MFLPYLCSSGVTVSLCSWKSWNKLEGSAKKLHSASICPWGVTAKTQNVSLNILDHNMLYNDIILHLPAALKSSSGGCTPVRQLKNRAAQRRKGSIPLFTRSATELPDTSGISLMSKPQNNLSNELKAAHITVCISEHAAWKRPWQQGTRSSIERAFVSITNRRGRLIIQPGKLVPAMLS